MPKSSEDLGHLFSVVILRKAEPKWPLLFGGQGGCQILWTLPVQYLFSFSMLNFTLFFQARHGAQSLALPVCSKMLSWDQACLWLELCNRLTVDWCFSALPKLPWGVQQSMSMLVLVWAFFFGEVGLEHGCWLFLGFKRLFFRINSLHSFLLGGFFLRNLATRFNRSLGWDC